MAENDIIIDRGINHRRWTFTQVGVTKDIKGLSEHDSPRNAVIKMQQAQPKARVGVRASVFGSPELQEFSDVVWFKKIVVN